MIALLYFVIGVIYYLTDSIGRKDDYDHQISEAADNHPQYNKDIFIMIGKIVLVVIDIIGWPVFFIIDIRDYIKARKEND